MFSCEDKNVSEPCEILVNDIAKEYADENWSLENWVFNRFNPPYTDYNGRSWFDFYELIRLTGYNELKLTISGDLGC